MSATNPECIDLKIIFVGASHVGKSSLIQRFVRSAFSEHIPATAAAAYASKEAMIGGAKVKFCIWDTAGQEVFRSIVPMYYRNADAVFVVADLSSQQSVSEVNFWLQQVRTHTSRQETTTVLVGNKCDLGDDALQALQDYVDFLPSNNNNNANSSSKLNDEMPPPPPPSEAMSGGVYVTSAKTGEGVFEMFEEVGLQCVHRVRQMRATAAAASPPSKASQKGTKGGLKSSSSNAGKVNVVNGSMAPNEEAFCKTCSC
eukprot:PhM_4_TR3863/c0_g1_i1/m.52622